MMLVNKVIKHIFVIYYIHCSSASQIESTISQQRTSESNKDLKLYRYYDLEDHCTEEDKTINLTVYAWNAAVLRIGYTLAEDGSLAVKKIHKCKVNLQTPEKFRFAVAIEYMKIRGKRSSSNKWICSDYIELSSPPRSTIGSVLFDIGLNDFLGKTSEKLCGIKYLNGSSQTRMKIYDQSTDANSFHSSSHKMSLYFHQDNDEKELFNNSFIVVVTTYRHASDYVFAVECQNKKKCFTRSDIYCIDPSFVCDGHINCAFPGSGTDEQECEVASPAESLNLTSIVIIVLVSLVAMGIIICGISTVACRMKNNMDNSRRRRRSASFNLPASDPSAPRVEGEATLPQYDVAVLSDVDEETVKSFPLPGDLPPQYDTLFPEGPPDITKEGEAGAS